MRLRKDRMNKLVLAASIVANVFLLFMAIFLGLSSKRYYAKMNAMGSANFSRAASEQILDAQDRSITIRSLNIPTGKEEVDGWTVETRRRVGYHTNYVRAIRNSLRQEHHVLLAFACYLAVHEKPGLSLSVLGHLEKTVPVTLNAHIIKACRAYCRGDKHGTTLVNEEAKWYESIVLRGAGPDCVGLGSSIKEDEPVP